MAGFFFLKASTEDYYHKIIVQILNDEATLFALDEGYYYRIEFTNAKELFKSFTN